MLNSYKNELNLEMTKRRLYAAFEPLRVQPVFTSGDKKMKNIYVFILCLPLILSCKQKKQSTPTYDNSWCAVEMEEQYIWNISSKRIY